jgi:hypothetical protein
VGRRWRKLTGIDVLAGELTEMTRRAIKAEVNAEELRENNRRIAERNDQLLATFRLLTEPATGDDCTKIRLHDKEQARAFAARVERECGAEPGTLEPYACPLCPRQPVSSSRYLHVRHVDRDKRGKGAAQYRGTRPREAGRINPAQMAKAME